MCSYRFTGRSHCMLPDLSPDYNWMKNWSYCSFQLTWNTHKYSKPMKNRNSRDKNCIFYLFILYLAMGEPRRRKRYSEDLRWRIVWQHKIHEKKVWEVAHNLRTMYPWHCLRLAMLWITLTGWGMFLEALLQVATTSYMNVMRFCWCLKILKFTFVSCSSFLCQQLVQNHQLLPFSEHFD